VRDNGAEDYSSIMTIVNFTIDKTTMEIPQFTLYYFKKDSNGRRRPRLRPKPLTIPPTFIGRAALCRKNLRIFATRSR
jgi:hypothetical protein